MSYTQRYFLMSENATWIKIHELLFLIRTTEDRGPEIPSCSVKSVKPVCLNIPCDADTLLYLG